MPLSKCFHIAEVLETTKKNAMHTFFNVIQKSTILAHNFHAQLDEWTFIPQINGFAKR